MFNYHNRQYVFRQSNGELWNFLCDSRQALCYTTLTRRGIWSNPVMLHKNTYQYFYADMDQEDIFHLLFQDNEGNIHYSRLDGQSIKTVPVLNTKTPSVYNKQLFMAPFKNGVHFFYVLQHDNAFMLAYQVLSNNKISNPKVIDYVSGSSLPCSVIYDKAQNIYAFYQSYDGKYLQLGYKKFNTLQKTWSEFTPITKYTGNCEYPHAIIDKDGIIHLCYQRRAPKLFEMVYQTKAPDKNLWTPEVIVHSSVHSFENTSILQINGNIIVYWVREDTIYHSTGPQTGGSWSKPSKFSFPTGRQLQCLSYKSNSPRDRGDSAGDSLQLPPEIYPGSLLNGLKLAFVASDNIGSSSPLYIAGHEESSSDRGDVKRMVLDSFKQIQGSVDEARAGWSATRDELAKLTNAYDELVKQMGKYTIRLNMLENQLGQSKKLNSRLDALANEFMSLKNGVKLESVRSEEVKETQASLTANQVNNPESTPDESKAAKKPGLSLEPDKLKEWEEWEGPEEWKDIGV